MFYSELKSKSGNILTKTTALRINLNIDGVPITSRSHHHPSHSQTSRLLSSSLSLDLPFPRDWECEKNYSIIWFLTFIPICWVKHIYLISNNNSVSPWDPMTCEIYCERHPQEKLGDGTDLWTSKSFIKLHQVSGNELTLTSPKSSKLNPEKTGWHRWGHLSRNLTYLSLITSTPSHLLSLSSSISPL